MKALTLIILLFPLILSAQNLPDRITTIIFAHPGDQAEFD